MTDQIKKEKIQKVSYIVFVFTLTLIVINYVFLFFPALLATLITDSDTNVNPFEPGIFALPILAANVIVFYFWYLIHTKNLPRIQNSFKFILNFEISRKVAAIVIVILLGGYIVFTAQDLTINELDEWPDFKRLIRALIDFPFGHGAVETAKAPIVKNFLLYSSQIVFQNVKVIPFIGSIALLLMTYFLTLAISKKRFAGIIAMIIVLQSHTFLRYDTSATYSYFWTLFFVLSLYLIYKRWYLSPVSYFLSVFSKLITVAFLPMMLFFIYKARIPKKKKIRITITYLIIAAILVGTITVVNSVESIPVTSFFENLRDFNMMKLLTSFTVWGYQLRFDPLILLFILPLTVGLFVTSRNGIPEADSILVLILGFLLLSILMPAFTFYNLQPYRLIPLIIFFAVGVGTLFSKKITQSV